MYFFYKGCESYFFCVCAGGGGGGGGGGLEKVNIFY